MPAAITPLISCTTLDALLRAKAERPHLIDLRLAADGGRTSYLEGHIPHAVFSDYAGDSWRAKIGNVPGLLPSETHLRSLFSKLGIMPAQHIVLVPVGTTANDFAASARAYWTLKLMGHKRLSILDGGTKAWEKAGLPLSKSAEEIPPAPPYPIEWHDALRSQIAEVTAAIDGHAQLLDARAASYFEGREKASEAKAAGHIPTALSLDYATAFDGATGALKPKAALTALFSPALAAASAPQKAIISYCNTGHTAALNWFVLSEILGHETSLYDGSMTEWTQDEARPIAR